MKKVLGDAIPSRFRSVEIDPEICNGCNMCVDVCIMDVFVANEERGKPPHVAYPEECWFDGCCVEMCHRKEEGAIRINTPPAMKVSVASVEAVGSWPVGEREGGKS